MNHRVYSLAMKINRHGRAKVLTQSEIQLIFSDGLNNDRDACGGLRLRALFGGVCKDADDAKNPRSGMGLIKIKLQNILQKMGKTCSLTTQSFLQYNQGELFYNLCHCTNQDSSLENNTDKRCHLCSTQI